MRGDINMPTIDSPKRLEGAGEEKNREEPTTIAIPIRLLRRIGCAVSVLAEQGITGARLYDQALFGDFEDFLGQHEDALGIAGGTLWRAGELPGKNL
jgi:hypothetical protein